MDLISKLEILADAAKYDVSCSSSGSNRKNTKNGLGNAHLAGICHSWSEDGRCISLLKILLTNDCIYNCAYCINRVSNDIPRASFTPGEVVDLTISFYRRNYIEGLFLSSAVFFTPDYTMELLTKTVKSLRLEHNFNGYIHLKAIPGADLKLINVAGRYVDRMSVNIELPTSNGLKLLAPQKNKESILKPMGYIKACMDEIKEERGRYRSSTMFVPAGQTTQLIVGATPDHDINILRLSEGLYKAFKLKRVYYSAYVPVTSHPSLPAIMKPPLLREHRLYQADWLLRFYGFDAHELLSEENPDFDVELDPKCSWALNNMHLFPVEINTADYSMLLRIPGIGIRSAQRIIAARRVRSLDFDSLKKLGVVLKRAQYFITCSGRCTKNFRINETMIRHGLTSGSKGTCIDSTKFEQLSIFSYIGQSTGLLSRVRGEL